MAGIDFFNKVAALAEDEGHHPDLHLEGYRQVTIVLWTHAVGGLTENDFILAAKINQIPVGKAVMPAGLKEASHRASVAGVWEPGGLAYLVLVCSAIQSPIVFKRFGSDRRLDRGIFARCAGFAGLEEVIQPRQFDRR